jgi:beta-mannosidase
MVEGALMQVLTGRVLIIVSAVLTFWFGTPYYCLATTFSLSGSDWFIHEDSSSTGVRQKFYEARVKEGGWLPARVPGNIQADLEENHLLGPLWYGAGDPRLGEVAKKDWWYRKDFTVPGGFLKERLTLVFDGVDFECEVWLNGQRLGGHAGQFGRFEFDVSKVAKPGEVNHLAGC